MLTPLFTGVDEKSGVLEGIFVNRGRIPYEYKDSKMHHSPADTKEEVTGLLFYSEGSGDIKKDLAAQTGKPLGPDEGGIVRFDLNKFIESTSLSHAPEGDIARKIYVKVVDLTQLEDRTLSPEQLLPKPATPQDMCNFYVTPARHQAYSSFWLYGTCLNFAANVFIWVYF